MDLIDVRWAFKLKDWIPTKKQMIDISSYVQTEEKDRVARFVFQNDAKSSLVGRLMMRKFVHLHSTIPYEEIRFGRDEHGKPHLLGAGDIFIDFNISHQGDYVVLAGNRSNKIGIDVMNIEPPANKDVKEFFRLMKRQFSDFEWKTVNSYPTERQQMTCFYRLWCLKESYVKNVGVGITIPLNQISFSIKTPLKVGETIKDTVLYQNGVLKENWTFEETLLDETHAVAVSIQIASENHKIVPFSYIAYYDLVKEAKPFVERDVNFASNFIKKELKSF